MTSREQHFLRSRAVFHQRAARRLRITLTPPFRRSFQLQLPTSESLPDSERYGGFSTPSHKICGEQMVLYADMFYQNVRTLVSVGPRSRRATLSPRANTTLAIPPHAPGATLGGPTYEETGVPMGAFNPFNPFQQIISGGTRSRLAWNSAIVSSITETEAFFSTIGLKGDKLFDGNWGYDASIPL